MGAEREDRWERARVRTRWREMVVDERQRESERKRRKG